MNNLIKFCLIALFTFSITACDNAQEEFAQISKLDIEFVNAVNSNKDKTQFIPILKAAQKKYLSLDIRNADIKAFRDESVLILKDTESLVELFKNIRTEGDRKVALAKKVSLIKRGNKLKVMKAQLIKKYIRKTAVEK